MIVPIIFPVNLQTDINFRMLSIGKPGGGGRRRERLATFLLVFD